MTRLEELKAALKAALKADWATTCDAAFDAALNAYYAELNKKQEENSND
jgi:hypothetical protein